MSVVLIGEDPGRLYVQDLGDGEAGQPLRLKDLSCGGTEALEGVEPRPSRQAQSQSSSAYPSARPPPKSLRRYRRATPRRRIYSGFGIVEPRRYAISLASYAPPTSSATSFTGLLARSKAFSTLALSIHPS